LGSLHGEPAAETGRPLDGANKYTISFEKGAAPPVKAFWSITLYDPNGFQVANPVCSKYSCERKCSVSATKFPVR
jgi:hypothetical protein